MMQSPYNGAAVPLLLFFQIEYIYDIYYIGRVICSCEHRLLRINGSAGK